MHAVESSGVELRSLEVSYSLLPPHRLSYASLGETWALQSILGPAVRPRPRTPWSLRAWHAGTRGEPRHPWVSRSRRRHRGTRMGLRAAETLCSMWLPPFAPSARSLAHWPEPLANISCPQTASRGDATACVVPLKAVGSAHLSFSTGCQNMQIRGPESAAKSRRRGAADASPDPLLVWLFPAWPAARRPSLQPPEPLLRPAQLSLPPTSPGRPPAPQRGSRGREALHARIPAGARAAAELSLPAPRGRRGAPGAQCFPGIDWGAWREWRQGRGRRGSRAAGIPPIPRTREDSGETGPSHSQFSTE